MGDLEKLEARITGLREQNLKSLVLLNKNGRNVDLSTARVEVFKAWLVELGVITEMQLLEEQEKWELHLRESLKPIVERVKTDQRINGRRRRG